MIFSLPRIEAPHGGGEADCSVDFNYSKISLRNAKARECVNDPNVEHFNLGLLPSPQTTRDEDSQEGSKRDSRTKNKERPGAATVRYHW